MPLYVEMSNNSIFSESGLKETLTRLKDEVRELYCHDDVPWIVGYSGGKDSTAVLQLIWIAIAELPGKKRSKKIHVISTDTLVENPVVSMWVTKSLDIMSESAKKADLPIETHQLTPKVEDSFWVNLIGKGYPAPRHKFRWCTERLKISPSNRFIKNVVREQGTAILALGSRRAESSTRAAALEKHARKKIRDRLAPNASLPGSLIYTPIEDWSNDDVWLFLMQIQNPWGLNNKDLLTMYAGATSDGECPLVVDTSTPSCGDSRFGCWVCTLVEKDKSMSAMIQNDEEKDWMMPLLDLRNALDFRNMPEGDRHLRDFRRLHTGAVQIMNDGRHVPGPYLQDAREEWLTKLLEAQTWIRENGPDYVNDIELISLDELQEIRRIWVIDKHEIEDRLPRIYEEVIGEGYPGTCLDDSILMGPEEMGLLSDICGADLFQYELIRDLLSTERKHRANSRRSGLYDELERVFRRGFYESQDEALELGATKAEARKEASEGKLPSLFAT